jgi:hypothetical protein
MSAATVAGGSAIGADLGRIVGAANVEVRPTALVPYRTCFDPADDRQRSRGAAGTYAIVRPRESRRILEAKLAALAELDLDFLAVVNPGCRRQLIAGLRRARLRTRVLHLAELVALAQAESAGR